MTMLFACCLFVDVRWPIFQQYELDKLQDKAKVRDDIHQENCSYSNSMHDALLTKSVLSFGNAGPLSFRVINVKTYRSRDQ